MSALSFITRQAPPPRPEPVAITLFEVRLSEIDGRNAYIEIREGLGAWHQPLILRRGDSIQVTTIAEKA